MPYSSNTAFYGPRQDLLGALYSTAPSQQYIATEVLPKMQTFAREGRYAKVISGKALRLVKSKRASGAGFARVSTPLDSATFLCEERGIEEQVDRTNNAIYKSMLDQEQVAARTAYHVMKIDHEADVVAAIFNETTFPASGTTGLVVTAWSTAATATPIADMNVGKKNIFNKIGVGPVALICNDTVVRNLWKTADVREQMKYGYGRVIEGSPQLDVLATVLGVDRIIQGTARYNSANANATPTMASIWSDTYAFLARIDNGQTLDAPQLGRTFANSIVYNESGDDVITIGDETDPDVFVEMYADKATASTIVRAREFTDEVIMDSSAGFLFKTVT